jgi:transposase
MSWIAQDVQYPTRLYAASSRGIVSTELRKEVVFMYYCGIDIAKRKHEASVIDESGKLLSKSFPFDNSSEGASKLFAYFSENGIGKSDVVVGLEATGHYWLALYSYLTDEGCDVKVINPIQSDAFRKMYIRQTKNDSKDSFAIAQIMRFGEYHTTELSDENVIALRQLSRYRLCLVESAGDCKRRIITLLD